MSYKHIGRWPLGNASETHYNTTTHLIRGADAENKLMIPSVGDDGGS